MSALTVFLSHIVQWKYSPRISPFDRSTFIPFTQHLVLSRPGTLWTGNPLILVDTSRRRAFPDTGDPPRNNREVVAPLRNTRRLCRAFESPKNVADETWPLEFHRYHATDDSPGEYWMARSGYPPLSRERGGLKQGVGPCTHSRDVRIDVFYDLVISLYGNLIHRWDEISEFLPALKIYAYENFRAYMRVRGKAIR